MSGIASKSKHFLLLGQCIPSVKTNATKIRVRRMVLDPHINMVSFFCNAFEIKIPNLKIFKVFQKR